MIMTMYYTQVIIINMLFAVNTPQTGDKPHVHDKAGVDDQLTMTVLRNFPVKSRKIDLASRISSSNYKRFGRCLLADDTGAKLSIIESTHRGKIQDINDEVFQEWLAGSGKEPVLMETFLGCLEEAGLKSLMKDIRDEL